MATQTNDTRRVEYDEYTFPYTELACTRVANRGANQEIISWKTTWTVNGTIVGPDGDLIYDTIDDITAKLKHDKKALQIYNGAEFLENTGKRADVNNGPKVIDYRFEKILADRAAKYTVTFEVTKSREMTNTVSSKFPGLLNHEFSASYLIDSNGRCKRTIQGLMVIADNYRRKFNADRWLGELIIPPLQNFKRNQITRVVNEQGNECRYTVVDDEQWEIIPEPLTNCTASWVVKTGKSIAMAEGTLTIEATTHVGKSKSDIIKRILEMVHAIFGKVPIRDDGDSLITKSVEWKEDKFNPTLGLTISATWPWIDDDIDNLNPVSLNFADMIRPTLAVMPASWKTTTVPPPYGFRPVTLGATVPVPSANSGKTKVLTVTPKKQIQEKVSAAKKDNGLQGEGNAGVSEDHADGPYIEYVENISFFTAKNVHVLNTKAPSAAALVIQTESEDDVYMTHEWYIVRIGGKKSQPKIPAPPSQVGWTILWEDISAGDTEVVTRSKYQFSQHGVRRLRWTASDPSKSYEDLRYRNDIRSGRKFAGDVAVDLSKKNQIPFTKSGGKK